MFYYGEELGKYVAVLWGSSHSEVNWSKVTMELCRDHTAVWKFSWICRISSEQVFERNICGTASVSLTQGFVPSINHILVKICLLLLHMEALQL